MVSEGVLSPDEGRRLLLHEAGILSVGEHKCKLKFVMRLSNNSRVFVFVCETCWKMYRVKLWHDRKF